MFENNAESYVIKMEYSDKLLFSYKTLYKFSPDPAGSCVAVTQASHRDICILCNILLHFI